MKTNWFIAFVFLVSLEQAQSQSHDFTFRGQITGAPVKFLYLKYINDKGVQVQDSSAIQNGSFAFKGKISEPTRAIFKANSKPIPDETNLNTTPIYLEPTSMQARVVYDHFREIQVTGSKTQREYDSLEVIQVPIRQEMMALQNSLNQLKQQSGNDQAATQTKLDSINNLLEKVIKKLQFNSPYQFIIDHPDSFVSVDYLRLFKDRWPIDTVRLFYNRMSITIQKSRDGQAVARKIGDMDRTSAGTTAFDFSGTDVGGKPIKLSSFKGKYVLLDFWGSWCGPCRAGNPHLIELYSKHKAKGVEFIGIACDDTPTAWRKAIEKDKIGIWQHLMDGEPGDKKTDSKKSIREQYAVDSFPTKILIDPNGIILSRYGNSQQDNQALDQKLDQLFK